MSCLISKSKLRLTVGRKKCIIVTYLLPEYLYSNLSYSFGFVFFFKQEQTKIRMCITNKNAFHNEKSKCKKTILIKLVIFNLY